MDFAFGQLYAQFKKKVCCCVVPPPIISWLFSVKKKVLAVMDSCPIPSPINTNLVTRISEHCVFLFFFGLMGQASLAWELAQFLMDFFWWFPTTSDGGMVDSMWTLGMDFLGMDPGIFWRLTFITRWTYGLSLFTHWVTWQVELWG